MLISSAKPFSGDSDNASLPRWNYYAVDDFNTTELRAFCDFLEYIVLAVSSFSYATWIRTQPYSFSSTKKMKQKFPWDLKSSTGEKNRPLMER